MNRQMIDYDSADDDEVVDALVDAYESRDWEELQVLAVEAHIRDIDRQLGLHATVKSRRDRLDRAHTHLRAITREMFESEGGYDQIEAALRLIEEATRQVGDE